MKNWPPSRLAFLLDLGFGAVHILNRHDQVLAAVALLFRRVEPESNHAVHLLAGLDCIGCDQRRAVLLAGRFLVLEHSMSAESRIIAVLHRLALLGLAGEFHD